MMQDNITVTPAVREDVPLILRFITGLAEYVMMLDELEVTAEKLEQTLFDKPAAQVLIARYDGKPAGFALYFYNYSTFLGKPGLYLEDLFVLPEYRQKQIGKRLLTTLAKIARSEGCGRMEWACLDWNESSIRFYKQMGAVPLEDSTTYRLTGEALDRAAELD